MSRDVEVSGGGGTGRGAPGTSKGAGQCPVCVNRVKGARLKNRLKNTPSDRVSFGKGLATGPERLGTAPPACGCMKPRVHNLAFLFFPFLFSAYVPVSRRRAGPMRAQAQEHLSEEAGQDGAAGRPAAGAVRGSGAPCPSPAQGATPLLLPDLCFPPSNANPLGSERLASNPLLEACA